MEVCEICGRHPAKRMVFKSHHGYVLARGEKVYDGVLCRDHAIMAASQARAGNLKGMWFSESSLLFGAFRLAWDSLKLLDLPEQVKDAPFVAHFFQCPYCNASYYDSAGFCICPTCGGTFALVSCGRCELPRTQKVGAIQDVTPCTCDFCKSSTDPLLAVRNFPQLVFCRSLIEFVKVGCPSRFDEKPHGILANVIEEIHPFPKAWIPEFLSNSLEKSFDRHDIDKLITSLPPLAIVYTLCLVGNVWEQWKSREFARSKLLDLLDTVDFGFNDKNGFIDELFPSSEGHYQARGSAWWDVLSVNRDSSLEEIRTAYRSKMLKMHPDLFGSASDGEIETMRERTKELNYAYDCACRYFNERTRDPSSTHKGMQAQDSQQVCEKPEEPSVSEEIQSIDQTLQVPIEEQELYAILAVILVFFAIISLFLITRH